MKKAAIISIILAILIIGAIAFFTIKFSIGRQGIIPPSCILEEESKTLGSFQCPNDATLCEATVTLDCNVQSGAQPKVIARRSFKIPYGSGTISEEVQCMAYDLDLDGALDPLYRTGTFGANDEQIPSIIFDDNYGITRESLSKIRYMRYGATKGKTFTASGYSGTNCVGKISLSQVPTGEDGTCHYDEICDTDDMTYSCSEDITGDVTTTVTYKSNVAGSKSKTVTLDAGQEIFWGGDITYKISTVRQSECQKSVAGSFPNSYFECNIGIDGCGIMSDSETFCEGNLVFSEYTEECGVPYDLEISLTKNSYAISEKIAGTMRIFNTQDISNIPIQIRLTTLAGNLKSHQTTSTDGTGRASFTLDGQSMVGSYIIIVEAEHQLGINSIEKQVIVSEPIQVRVTTNPVQYNAVEIVANAFVTDDQGNPKDAADFDFSGTNCGGSDYSNKVSWTRVGRVKDQGTKYDLGAFVNRECTFTFKVVAIDGSGLRSAPDTSTPIEIRSSEIIIESNLEEELQDADEGKYTISFRTLDSDYQKVSSTNQVVITHPNLCKSGTWCEKEIRNLPDVQVTGSGGAYQFTYTFGSGLHLIDITSIGQGIQSTTQSYAIHFFQSTDPYDPDDPDDPDNPKWYENLPVGAIIAGIIMALGLAFFFYFVFRKKKT